MTSERPQARKPRCRRERATPEGYRDDLFLEHLLGGIEAAAGAPEPACGGAAAGSRRSFPGNATTPNG